MVDYSDMNYRMLISTLTNFLRDHNLKAGISNTFSNLKEFKNTCYQGYKAINIANKLNCSDLIYYYNDFITDNLVFIFLGIIIYLIILITPIIITLYNN